MCIRDSAYTDDLDEIAENYPLPKVVEDWITEASKYSNNNEFPISILYFVCLGQILKDFVRLPVDSSMLDCRIHFAWFQSQRSGKTAVWKFIKQILEGTFERINAHESIVNGDTKSMDIFSVHEYTDAALIGTTEQNPAYNPPQDPDELDEYDVESYIKYDGGLEGAGLAHFDEFESSGIFKQHKHKDNVLMYFQTFMNGLDSESYIIRKKLARQEFVQECDCSRSLYATTYVPVNFIEVVANSGVLQRPLTFVREVTDEERRIMILTYISKIGIKNTDEMQLQRFSNHLARCYVRTHERWIERGRNAEEVMIFPDSVRDVIRQYYLWVQNDVESLRPEVKRIAESFIINLIQYQTMFAGLIAISNGRFNMTVADAHCAGRMVRHSYSALTEWLNKALRVQRKSVFQAAKPDAFIQAYHECVKDQDGYVNKKLLLKEYMKAASVAQAQAYRLYNKIETRMFDTKNFGRSVYVKLKEEEL